MPYEGRMKASAVVWAAMIGFVIPWQTRYLIVTPEVGAVAWEFGIVSLYVSQIVIGTWLATQWWHARHNWRAGISWRVIVLVALCGVQLVISQQRLLTLQLVVSAMLLGGLVYTLYRHGELRVPFLVGFLISSVLQAMIGCLQVLFGASFASTILGIAAHRASDAGVAVVVADGIRHLRAYGGQPHPNIFGFQMVVALIAVYHLVGLSAITIRRSTITQITVLFAGALVLSFSRTALISFALVACVWWLMRKHTTQLQHHVATRATITIMVLCVVLFPLMVQRVNVQQPLEERSIVERISSVQQWKGIFFAHPFFGVGWGAYTRSLPPALTGDLRVPIHNVPLLALAELGMAGVVVLVIVSTQFIKKIPPVAWAALAPPLLFDHYVFSLWSGLALAAVLLIVSRPVDDKPTVQNHRSDKRIEPEHEQQHDAGNGV